MCLAASVSAEPRRCNDSLFVVDAKNAELASQLCETLPELRDRLESCGLRQDRVLTVEVVEQVDHPLGNCLAYFDCDYDLIRLTEPTKYASILDQDRPYAQLPTDVLFRALITHELTHALVTQSADERAVDIVDQEYIAAAMELDLMEPEHREVILQAAPVDLPPKEGLIDIWIYGFTPRKFAVNAWQHFRAQEDGCAFIQEIVSGKHSFAKAIRPDLR